MFFFLSGKSAVPDPPPPLVENSTIFFSFFFGTLPLYTEFNNLLVFREGLSCRHHLLPGQAYNMFMIVFMLSLRILINPLIEILSIN